MGLHITIQSLNKRKTHLDVKCQELVFTEQVIIIFFIENDKESN